MFALVKDNQVIRTGEIRQLFPDISFPSTGPDTQWLNDNGVKEVVNEERKDERFYWVSPQAPTYDPESNTVKVGYQSIERLLNDREESDQEGNPLFLKVYDPLANDGKGAMVDSTQRLITSGLKTQWNGQVKAMAGTLLSPTDWMVVRKLERNISIPTEVQTFRLAVIAEAGRLESAIASCTTVEALIEVIAGQNWPKVQG